MRVRVVSCLLMAILLSGCLASHHENPDPAPPVIEEPPLGTTRTISVDHTAEAGGWLVLWTPFVYHQDQFRMIGEERFATAGTGGPDLAFFGPLDTVQKRENETSWGGRTSGSMGVQTSQFAITSHSRYQTTVHASANLFSGLFAFYSANVPWTLHIDITLESALLVEPRIITGQGASFFYGGAQEHGIRLPVGEVALSAETQEAGWTHIEFLYSRFQPRSEREIEVRFADGYEITGETRTSGLCTVTSCSAGRSGPGEQFGVINNTLGENMGRARYVEAGYGLDVAIVHLPGAEIAFPAEFNVTRYERWAWPFTSWAPPPQ